jgi:acyl-CoA reductase-like NAD-dependent aldehyde dehydrogenase
MSVSEQTVHRQDLRARRFGMLIDGEIVDGAASIDVIDPATEQVLAASPVASPEQIDEAVAAAAAAFPKWRDTPVDDRARSLHRLADAIERRAAELAQIITLEVGKPIAAARGDVDAAIAFTRYFADFRLTPQVMRDDVEARVEIRRKPLGVVAAILPWNFPFFQAMYKLAPALIVGNTIVMKPAPTTPLNAMLLGEMAAEIFPPGVVNVVGDDGSVGPLLTGHDLVRKVSFTGSTAVGKAVMAASSGSLKRVTLELGGNDSAIVMDDADIPTVARGIFDWAFHNCGQVCINIKRIYAPASIYDALCDEMAQIARTTKIGPGLDPETEMGPIQNAKQYETVKELLRLAHEDGEVIAGGDVIDGPGYFVEPTVVRDIADDSRLVSQETFGPIRSILKYEDIDDAIERANATPYGLGNSVWGTDLDRAAAVAERLDSGTAWVNTHFALTPDVPFGGSKESGMGVEFGEDGVNEFTDVQVINIARTSAGPAIEDAVAPQ